MWGFSWDLGLQLGPAEAREQGEPAALPAMTAGEWQLGEPLPQRGFCDRWAQPLSPRLAMVPLVRPKHPSCPISNLRAWAFSPGFQRILGQNTQHCLCCSSLLAASLSSSTIQPSALLPDSSPLLFSSSALFLSLDAHSSLARLLLFCFSFLPASSPVLLICSSHFTASSLHLSCSTVLLFRPLSALLLQAAFPSLLFCPLFLPSALFLFCTSH